VYPLHSKSASEVLSKYKDYSNTIRNKTQRPISTFRSDNGTEFVNHSFTNYLKSEGTVRELTIPMQASKVEKLLDWHIKLGHASEIRTKKFLASNKINYTDESYDCETCLMTKLKREAFPQISVSKSTGPYN
jgi:hypothetical protein